MGESAREERIELGGLAEVIQLHPEPRSCFTCANARFYEFATWCSIYEEVIDSEVYAAEDCFTYELCKEGDQPVLADDPREER